MSIRVCTVSKRFGRFTALDRVSVEAPEGCLLALLGPSGSGKTTLLRIIAGLETADDGSVLYQDQEVTRRPARDRNVGFVFQHYALFRHMDVFENIAFALRVRKWPTPKVKDRVQQLLHLIRLEGLERRYPSQLSGGQRQRVALARALAAEPRVLLLDEPFGALDARVRQELRQWLRRLHDEIHITSIFVTHDQEEAFAVADRVAVLREGRIEQAGTPQEVFEHPANAFVMDFLGNVNVFHGQVNNGVANMHGMQLKWPGSAYAESGPAKVYIRPHELDIQREPGEFCDERKKPSLIPDTTNGYHADNGPVSLPARVTHINPLGAVIRIQLETVDNGTSVLVELSPHRAGELSLKTGEVVHVAPRHARVFAPDYAI
jgi:sulfate/thiosulfate transport system ATP-binding protein